MSEIKLKEANQLQIKLNWIRLKNFKGIKEFTLNAQGLNVNVLADNGRGKTTLQDSFFWLLFGKDSTGRDGKTAKIKPQDENGKDIHHLQTEVEAELLVDGKPLKIKKMQEEKWTRKRGSDTKELTGNTVNYWWDEVPVKESEFKQKSSLLLDENIFKMITDPFYFNSQMKWQDRRRLLLEICGDASQEEVIASDEKLAKLTEILSGKSIEDYKKVLADKIKRLKKEKEDIPPRIDELTRGLPNTEEDYSEIEKEVERYKDILAGIESEMTNANAIVEAYKQKHEKLYALKGQLERVKSRIDSEAGATRRKLLEEKSELEEGKYTLESSIRTLQRIIKENEDTIQNNSKLRESLVKEWNSLKAEKSEVLKEEFQEPQEDFICPTCRQELPEETKEAKLEEMRSNFRHQIKNKITAIDLKIKENESKGFSLKASTETAQKAIEDSSIELEQKRESLLKLINKIREIDQELQKPVDQPDYSKDQEYLSLEEQISTLQSELERPIEDTTIALRQKKIEIQQKIDECNTILNTKDVIEKNKKRIEELKAEEKRISALITELEGHQYLLERFVVAKVNYLEDKINSKFKSVKFKMFEENISNDGIKECCEALVNTNGSYVPFADANLAGKINAGLDCINALGNYYGVVAPIWIDNRESVSEIIDTNSQIINLIKPPSWDELDKDVQRALAGVEAKEQLTIEDMAAIERAKKAWNDKNKVLRVEAEEN